MSLKVGIVGLPNVGKSTLFKALTKNPVDINNYPFCTIEPNVGVVTVPDDRLNQLAQMFRSKKVVPAVVEFVDIAGLVKGASEGEGLGNQFLANIREVDAIAHVVRAFPSSEIVHVHDTIDPARDEEIITTELILADMQTAQKVVARLEKDARGQNKDAMTQLVIAKKVLALLEDGKPARNFTPEEKEKDTTVILKKDMPLLSWKPVLFVLNTVETDGEKPDFLKDQHVVSLDIKMEEEINTMSQEDLDELGITPRINELVVSAYDLLGLMTFFTTGESESRAWTVKKNATAPEAGAAIHSDFQEKFIRADVIFWKDLIDIGAWGKAREIGKVKTVGKEYVTKNGDVMEFKA